MLRTVVSAFTVAVLIGCGTDSGSPGTMGPDAGPDANPPPSDPMVAWATTHCERRWMECAPVKIREYVTSCVAVATLECCTASRCDGSCPGVEPRSLEEYDACLESIRAASCDELGPVPACDPFQP